MAEVLLGSTFIYNYNTSLDIQRQFGYFWFKKATKKCEFRDIFLKYF